LAQLTQYLRHPYVLAAGIAAVTLVLIASLNRHKTEEQPAKTSAPENKIEPPKQKPAIKLTEQDNPTPTNRSFARQKKPPRKIANRQTPVPNTLPLSSELVAQESSPSKEAEGIAPPDAPAKTCFPIDHFQLEVPAQLPEATRAAGASTLPQDKFRFAQDELETNTGKCIGRDDLNDILKKLTAKILDRGYTTTRLGIPEQNLASGTLKLTLVPGMIRAIRFEPDETAVSWKTAFPARSGDLLNLRDLEQGLEQIKRVPSQDADMQILPGEKPGESDIIINHKQNNKTWKVTASLDDSGSNGTGKYQSSLNLSVDNLTGINDLFNMGINNDAGNKGGNRGTRGNNAYYSLPFGNWTYTLSGSNYQYHQKIAGTYQTFVSSGESNNLELKMSYLLHRDQTSKTTLQARTAKRWNSSFVDDTEIAVQRRNNTLAELSLSHKHNIGDSQLEITFAQRQGVHWFGAQADLANRLESDPTYFYELSVLDINLGIPFKVAGRPLKYTGTLHAQTTQSSVFASEYISIGNRWTVRGFDGETSLAAERGWYIRNEYETPVAESNQSIYIGLDMGMVYGTNVENLVGDHLVGAALGLRGSLLKGLYYDVFSGWPIYKPQHYTTGEPAAGFSLNYQF
jgi:hemolysin activation/secretion protein